MTALYGGDESGYRSVVLRCHDSERWRITTASTKEAGEETLVPLSMVPRMACPVVSLSLEYGLDGRPTGDGARDWRPWRLL